MEAEDSRGQLIYPDDWRNGVRPNGTPARTWRDEANERQEDGDQHVDTLNDIRDIVHDYRSGDLTLRESMADITRVLNANNFPSAPPEYSEVEMDNREDAAHDRRPLITPVLREGNRTLHNELWNRNQGETYAICPEPNSR